MPRLILHTGTPKTGSTALQAFLRANHEAFGARGLALFDLALTPQGGHQPLLWALFNGGDHPSAVELRSRLPAALGEADGRDLVVSGEGFATTNLGAGPADAFGRLRSVAAAEGYEVETLTMVGDYRHIAASSFAQRAKMFHAARPFEAEIRATTPAHAYVARHVDPIRALGVRSTFLPFDAATRARGIERTVLDWLEWDDTGLHFPERANERPGVVRVAAALALAERHLAAREIVVAQAARCGRAVEEACTAIAPDDPPFRPLTPTLTRWLDKQNRPSAEAFAREVWGRDWADVFGAAEPETSTIDTVCDPARRFAQAAEVVAAAEPAVLRHIADDALRERFPSSPRVPARKQLVGHDVF